MRKENFKEILFQLIKKKGNFSLIKIKTIFNRENYMIWNNACWTAFICSTRSVLCALVTISINRSLSYATLGDDIALVEASSESTLQIFRNIYKKKKFFFIFLSNICQTLNLSNRKNFKILNFNKKSFLDSKKNWKEKQNMELLTRKEYFDVSTTFLHAYPFEYLQYSQIDFYVMPRYPFQHFCIARVSKPFLWYIQEIYLKIR